MTVIDRPALLRRHRPIITAPHPVDVLTVGNGDLAITVDMTGLQSLPEFHRLQADPAKVADTGVDGLPQQPRREFDKDDYQIPLRTQSTWGWYRTRGRREYLMTEASTSYSTPRGDVPYPDRMGLELPVGPVTDDVEAAAWLNFNPRRLHLGRLALVLPGQSDLAPTDIVDGTLMLELEVGRIDAAFQLRGAPVEVSIVVDPHQDRIAARVSSPLLRSGLAVAWIFDPQQDALAPFEAPLRDDVHWRRPRRDRWVARHEVEDAAYLTGITVGGGWLEAADEGERAAIARSAGDELEIVVDLVPFSGELPAPGDFPSTRDAAAKWWRTYWSEGAAISLDGSTAAEAVELERRIVLSQYLTAVNCAGRTPPQETGLIYNTWEGKFHLEMHWWHAAHFPMWHRGKLLERSLGWYHDILPVARSTAERQGYAGVRWPKQTDPSGRESPSIIGSFIIWQQPHLIYLLDLLRAEGRSPAFMAEHLELIDETAAFMSDFVEERDGRFHLPAPLVPAQESYLVSRATTENPTFELAYWAWALRAANDLREHAGIERVPRWDDVSDRMAAPHVMPDGTYAAVGSPPHLIREDHPSMLMAMGWLPDVPLIDPTIMRATLDSVLRRWDIQSTWGWDYPFMAMLATRLGDNEAELDLLLQPTPKNVYLINGHNPQMPGFLSLYLPANGGLLAAMAHLAQAVLSGRRLPVGWQLTAEGFPKTEARSTCCHDQATHACTH